MSPSLHILDDGDPTSMPGRARQRKEAFVPTGYESGFYGDIRDIERNTQRISEELGRIAGFFDDSREFIHESIRHDEGLVSILRGIRDALASPPPQVVITIEARCWCSGKVGFRDPGDEQGLGCLENIHHAWRGESALQLQDEAP